MNDVEMWEKVIKGLECCTVYIDCNENGECPYKQISNCLETMLKDAYMSLKAQEPIEARLHLCDSCKKQYPECDATKDGVAFGSGTGNDNIIGCTAYVNRWMPQNEPRVMTLEEYDAWTDIPFTERDPVFHEERTERGSVTCWVNTTVCSLREYGKNDRCWTSRPDEKRSAETPWE